MTLKLNYPTDEQIKSRKDYLIALKNGLLNRKKQTEKELRLVELEERILNEVFDLYKARGEKDE